MCLAIPGKILKKDGENAIVDFNGVRRKVNTSFLEDSGVLVGEYVLVHVGYAIQKVDEMVARETYRLLDTQEVNNELKR